MIRKNSEYPLQPPRERGTWRAFVFALVMHALLGFFLYHGIQWQNSTPEGAEAELWTEVPDSAIPRPPPPPPVPVAPAPPLPDEQADIALQEKKRQQQEAARQAQLAEQLRQQKLQAQQEAEAKRQQQLAADQAAQKAAAAKQKQLQQQQQQQADKLKQQQLADQQKQQQEQQKQADAEAQKKADAQKAAKAKAQADAAAQAKKLDAERRARLAQMQGSAGAPGSTGNGLAKSGTGSGSGGTATSPGYADKVRRVVRPNISWGGETEGLETVISVRCSPTGTLLDAQIAHSSGNSAWDDAALRAVQRSNPMPQDIDGKTPTSFKITLRPAG
ncbi:MULTISPECIES: cell envelope integrity protein TolA [Paraburkholderia]|jgi:colicin import membrane protein|uniref:Cell division and transport-associated protein TolA n=1 Tax=Paraburkholderia aspalathi TaxID=1324617 RepID=A0A1I7EMM6_9BURK|nr:MULTISPECIES: cell envelope integrity protein TolA [Paraburkholderia]MCP2086850.1 colicin import membrane protein [Paraburkholderia sediminicola]MBK3819200.1 cell envelope integrity protein TolA [Paraburkholderia aspalathi]MBK3831052.1 cell envelope integrity protein TolA [Paraburkholderia aspalathi]MBK3837908.1 cell envelope integrity protein TolA [Paraburkholderia aspalathi]MBK3860784.1 cell envelope integrity protein TolA [Paraburkholderia aspalathi]